VEQNFSLMHSFHHCFSSQSIKGFSIQRKEVSPGYTKVRDVIALSGSTLPVSPLVPMDSAEETRSLQLN
jgi:hypothetical protein